MLAPFNASGLAGVKICRAAACSPAYRCRAFRAAVAGAWATAAVIAQTRIRAATQTVAGLRCYLMALSV
jgi:hypothetical protein